MFSRFKKIQISFSDVRCFHDLGTEEKSHFKSISNQHEYDRKKRNVALAAHLLENHSIDSVFVYDLAVHHNHRNAEENLADQSECNACD